LGGDASGSISFDGSASKTLTVVVADDSHNHVISNVDGLQTALDSKSTLALGETSVTAYRGDLGKIGYDHSKVLHAPSNANYYEHPAAHAISVITGLQTALDGKSATTHAHDDRYYTETEVDAIVAALGGSAQIKTGQYTGDGSTSLAITGVGFSVKFVDIWPHTTGSADIYRHKKTDAMYGDLCVIIKDNHERIEGSHIIALGTDGFTVDDAGGDQRPNQNGVVYDYCCWG
jgi:hypothetical protein